jgi:hypothetical protein
VIKIAKIREILQKILIFRFTRANSIFTRANFRSLFVNIDNIKNPILLINSNILRRIYNESFLGCKKLINIRKHLKHKYYKIEKLKRISKYIK